MIEVLDLHKSYRETIAVSGLAFAVSPGEILGLVGPNGAGKTTTLRALAGIIPPTRGNLRIAGHDVVDQPVAAKRELAYIPDDPKLFDALTVWEHLQFIASVYRVTEFEPLANQLLERFELTDKRNAPGQELSRGMRQKVAICCAMLHRPRAILFDEPMTGLDPRGIRTLKDAIVELSAGNAAIIISSHLLELVEGMCSHLLILHRGQSLYCGRIADARAAFEAVNDASLEEVFFRAIEGQGARSGE